MSGQSTNDLPAGQHRLMPHLTEVYTDPYQGQLAVRKESISCHIILVVRVIVYDPEEGLGPCGDAPGEE